MASFNGVNYAKYVAGGATKVDAGQWGGKVRVATEQINLAAQASGDTINIARIPQEARILYGTIVSTVSLGSSTIKIGDAGDDDRLRADAVMTTANSPVMFGHSNGAAWIPTAETTVFITVGTATMPASGTMYTTIYYMVE